jgi:para-nitrobenzyl esterase
MSDIVVETTTGKVRGLTVGGVCVFKVARTISETFVRFAQDGDPNHPALPTWSPYTLGKRATMVFDATSRVENDPRPAIRKLYARLYSGS